MNDIKLNLEAILADLNTQIIECNEYLQKQSDTGQVQRKDDPLETISYTRGKSIGLIIARDKIKSILQEIN